MTLVPIGKRIYNILEPLALAVATGFVFNWLKVPVGWLVGPLVLGIAYGFIQGSPKPLPASFTILGKALIGISSAARFSPETLSLAQHYTLPLLLCIVTTAALSMLNGYLIWKWTAIERIDSFLGSIPGSAATVVAMSEELGADAAIVAVLQYLRMILVLLLVPLIATFVSPNLSTTQTSLLSTTPNPHSLPMMVDLLALGGCVSLGIILGKLLKLPTPGFLGSFLLAIVLFWSFPHYFYVPRPLFMTGLILVGLSTGLKFDWQTIRKLWKAVLLKSILVVFLIFCCLGIGYEFHLITGVDTMTALLSFTPGAIEAMIATVTQLGGDASLVLAIQMTRQLLILLTMNLLHLLSKSTQVILN